MSSGSTFKRLCSCCLSHFFGKNLLVLMSDKYQEQRHFSRAQLRKCFSALLGNRENRRLRSRYRSNIYSRFRKTSDRCPFIIKRNPQPPCSLRVSDINTIAEANVGSMVQIRNGQTPNILCGIPRQICETQLISASERYRLDSCSQQRTWNMVPLVCPLFSRFSRTCSTTREVREW